MQKSIGGIPRREARCLRYIFLVVVLAVPSLVAAQTWTPPIGIPHPGSWFLKTDGNVQTVTAGGTSRTFSGNGTADAPVIFRGVGSPTFTGTVAIEGQYVIVEGIVVNGGVVRFQNGSYLSLRSSEVKNNQGSISKATVSTTGTASYVVIYDNEIHDNGDWQGSSENDIHGITGSAGAHHIWIVDNHTYHHGGDSVQFGHNIKNQIQNVFIGRNTMHHDRENAVDIKEASNVVISQNTMYGYQSTSSSEGAAVVVHYCPINAQVIFNTIYDSAVGISSTSLLSDCATPVKVGLIGNVIFQISGNAIQGWGSGKATATVGNTIYNVSGAGIDHTSLASGSVIENNLLWSVQGTPIVATGTVTTRNNLADTSDPRFVGATAADFRLSSGSPAIDSGVSSSAYATFQSVYNLSIAVDHSGAARPQGGGWDIGAYEYGSATSQTVPIAPSALAVR